PDWIDLTVGLDFENILLHRNITNQVKLSFSSLS
ncbi:MAG: GIY-YIG nuclease family protein, partial [Pedobacter sp.]